MECMAMLLAWYFPISRWDLRKQRTHPGEENNANSKNDGKPNTPFVQFTALRDSRLLSSKLDAYRNYVLWIAVFTYLLLVTTRFIFGGGNGLNGRPS